MHREEYHQHESCRGFGTKVRKKAVRSSEEEREVNVLAGVENDEQDEEEKDGGQEMSRSEERRDSEDEDEDNEDKNGKGLESVKTVDECTKEVQEHHLTRCAHRIRGGGKDLDRRRPVKADRKIREFSFDYCFLGDERSARITVLVERERVASITVATVVPVKEMSGQFAAIKVLKLSKRARPQRRRSS